MTQFRKDWIVQGIALILFAMFVRFILDLAEERSKANPWGQCYFIHEHITNKLYRLGQP